MMDDTTLYMVLGFAFHIVGFILFQLLDMYILLIKIDLEERECMYNCM